MGRERFVDAGVVVFAGLLGMVGPALQPPPVREPYDLVAFCLLLAGAAALWFRRRAPVAVAWFVALLAAVTVVLVWVWPGLAPGARIEPGSVLLPAATPFAAYAVGAFTREPRSRRHGWWPLVVVAAVACVFVPPSTVVVSAVGLVVTLVAGPAVLGRYVKARAERAEREQWRRAERARREERLRLATEIHDVVSHRVSVMVLQAGALQLTAPDDPTRQAAEELRATGCRALDELRDLVRLLNTTSPTGTGTPEPLPDLSTLVEASVSAGLAVELAVAGEPVLLSPAVGRTGYRVVQEALTNAHKHAPGTRVHVEVRYLATGVRVSVHNTAPAAPGTEVAAEVAATGGGTGLLGLRRRVALVDGTLRARPRADGGFEVVADLPATVHTGGARP